MVYKPIYHNLQIWYMRTGQLKFKKELKDSPSRNNVGQWKLLRTGVEWKGSHWTIRKCNIREHKESHKFSIAWKYFMVKTWKFFLNILKYCLEASQFIIKAKQWKLRQVTLLKIICTLKYLVSSHKIKSRRFFQSWGRF